MITLSQLKDELFYSELTLIEHNIIDTLKNNENPTEYIVRIVNDEIRERIKIELTNFGYNVIEVSEIDGNLKITL